MKKKIISILLSACTLFALSGCDGAGNKSNVPLDIAHGIANQTYLYGMCYSLDERAYSTNTNFDVKTEVKLMANLGVTSVRVWMHLDSVLSTPTEVNEENAAKVHELVAELQKYGMQVIGMSHTSFHNGSYRSGKPARDVSEGSYYVEWLDDYYASWKTAAAEFSDISIFEIDNEMNNADFMCSLGGEKIYSQEEMAQIATDIYNAENVLSGYNRPYFAPNVCLLEKENAFLEISFQKRKVEEVRIVFNTDLAEDIIYSRSKKLIKDYEIEFRCEDKIERRLITDNIYRMNTFAVDREIDTIKIIPKANYGSEYFEIFGVKIY